ncbi:MAG: Ig-like domain-containing protein, partial [Desulfurivibrio sp.]
PDVIGIGEQSNLVAVVRDANDNLVKNQSIVFTVGPDTTSGTISPSPVMTDEYGRAETVYTAGSSGSAQNEVIIEAAVANTALITDTTITVGGKALFITLGTGNTIEVPDDQKYAKPYSVMVTDSSGHSVGGVEVALALWATHYHKGFHTWGGTAWVQNITAANCPNEDVNRNGISDPGEDYNGNTELDPGAVAAIHKQLSGSSIYTVTTDDSGFADFYIIYLKDRALWAGVELTASTLVQGSESTRRVYFTLPILAADLTNENVSPPGSTSPFGTAASCSDPN